MGIWYCTREQVKSATDSKESARNNRQVDRAIEAASRDVEALCHATFYPHYATKYFDWPNLSWSEPWRLWLDDNELISLTSLVSGGIPITTYFLEPSNEGPPFSSIEVDLSSSAAFSSGASWQRSVAVTGLFGYRDDQGPAGTLLTGIDDAEILLDVSDAASVGVGSLLTIGDERLLVLERRSRDTGATLSATLGANKAQTGIAVSDITPFEVEDIITVDSERMRVIDILGSTLSVIRAFDGTVLAAHSNAAPVYLLGGTVRVERGAVGSTPAEHLADAEITVWIPPSLIHLLTVAQAIDSVLQETSGYSRVVGSSSGEGGSAVRDNSGKALVDLRERTYTSHGRKARKYAI